MKPVKQTITDHINGNCMQACVASVFELPIDAVPNFMKDGPDKYNIHIEKWCESVGLKNIVILPGSDMEYLSDMDLIAVGTSPRSPKDDKIYHAVVWRNGKVVHDPFPNGKGFNGDPICYDIFVVKDYAKYGKLIKGADK